MHMLELLESILCCLQVRHFFFSFFSSLSRCNIDVLFNLRASSLTESGSCKDASGFSYVEKRSADKSVLGCKVATGYELVLSWLKEMTRVHRQKGAEGAELYRLSTSPRFGR